MPRHKWQFAISIGAVVLYNNWLLGLLLNPHASFAGATTSELGASDQHWSLLFRVLDGLAGLLFILSIGVLAKLVTSKKTRVLLLIGQLSLGISTIIETFVPLDCSSSLSKICSWHEESGNVSWHHNFHVFESVLTYALIALLPFAVWLAIRRRDELSKLKKMSLVLVIFMIIWALETALKFSHNVGSYGYEQRAFLLLFSWWYLRALRDAYTLEN